jgi:hypothetical protein
MTVLRLLLLLCEALLVVMLVRRHMGPHSSIRGAATPIALGVWAGLVSLGGAISHRMEWRSAGEITTCHFAVVLTLVICACWTPLSRGGGSADPSRPPSPSFESSTRAPRWFDRSLTACVVAALGLTIAGSVLHLIQNPNGGYDAWGMWNTKATVLSLDPGSWPRLIENLLAQGHPDYPLLLPLLISAGLEIFGPRTLGVPIFVACGFAVATFAIMWTALSRLKGTRFAAVAFVCSVGCYQFPMVAFDQYADIQVAFFLLCASVLVVDALRHEAPPLGSFLLAGTMLGCATWTKNEGNLIAVCVLVASIPTLARRRSFRETASILSTLALGALPFVILTLGFKAQVPLRNDLVAGLQGGGLSHLLDPERYIDVLYFGWKFVGEWGLGVGVPMLVGYFVFAARGAQASNRDRLSSRWLAYSLLLICGGYFCVFLTTPLDLEFHLKTAFSRLVCHLWPTALFLALLTRRDDMFSRLPGCRRAR